MVNVSLESIGYITKDTHVHLTLPNDNYGGQNFLCVSGDGTADARRRTIIECTMPANPYPNADIEIYKLELRFNATQITVADIVRAYLLSHNSWTEGVGSPPPVDNNDCTWNNYTTATAWEAAGGDYDSETDWSGKGAGIIDKKYINALVWYTFDLTPLLVKEGITWGDVFSIILILDDETQAKGIRFSSRNWATLQPRLRIRYRDPIPKDPIISAAWNKVKQKVEYEITIPEDDHDWKKMKLWRDTNSAPDLNDTAVKIDYDALENQSQITNPKAKNIIENYTTYVEPVEDTLYYVRGFSEDNNNTGANSTPSNEITFRRPKLKTSGNADKCKIIDKAGGEGTNIDVMEEVFIHVTPDTTNVSLNTMKEVYIDWGDGGKATYGWIAMNPSAHPGASPTTITVLKTDGLKVDDYICMAENIGGWKNEVRKITALTETVITVDSAFGAFAWTTGATIVKTRKHRYARTGSKEVLCQLENAQGFQSKKRSPVTAPDPQPLSPVAVIDAQKLTVDTNESIVLSGLRSKSKNMDKLLKWNTMIGPYTHDGGDAAAFAKDTGENFPGDGAAINWYVWNETDKCWGRITGFTGTDQANFAGGLGGGTGNNFDNGDVFYFMQSGWVKNVGTGSMTVGDRDAAVTTISFDTIGTKTVFLFIGDDNDPVKYDIVSIDIVVSDETFFGYNSNIKIVNANVAVNDTVTINGTTFTVVAAAPGDYEFIKGGFSHNTAENLAAAINQVSLANVYGVNGGDYVFLVGIVGTIITSKATAFICTVRTGTIDSIDKPRDMLVNLRRVLGGTTHVRNVISYGSTVYTISGKVGNVEDKDDMEKLNDHTYDFMILAIDGSLRKLYPLSKGAIISEKAKGYVPPKQIPTSTEGIWSWSGTFVDGGSY